VGLGPTDLIRGESRDPPIRLLSTGRVGPGFRRGSVYRIVSLGHLVSSEEPQATNKSRWSGHVECPRLLRGASPRAGLRPDPRARNDRKRDGSSSLCGQLGTHRSCRAPRALLVPCARRCAPTPRSRRRPLPDDVSGDRLRPLPEREVDDLTQPSLGLRRRPSHFLGQVRVYGFRLVQWLIGLRLSAEHVFGLADGRDLGLRPDRREYATGAGCGEMADQRSGRNVRDSTSSAV